jgi:hypothetical protein
MRQQLIEFADSRTFGHDVARQTLGVRALLDGLEFRQCLAKVTPCGALENYASQSTEKRSHRQQANDLDHHLATYFANCCRHTAHLTGIHSWSPHCRQSHRGWSAGPPWLSIGPIPNPSSCRASAANIHKIYWSAATVFLVGHLPPQGSKVAATARPSGSTIKNRADCTPLSCCEPFAHILL